MTDILVPNQAQVAKEYYLYSHIYMQVPGRILKSKNGYINDKQLRATLLKIPKVLILIKANMTWAERSSELESMLVFCFLESWVLKNTKA